MRPRLPRPLALATALLATTLAATSLVAGPAHADPAPGTLIVHVVDERGQPIAGRALAVDHAGYTFDADSGMAATPVATFHLDPGSYGVVVVTPFGGLTCLGVQPCTFAEQIPPAAGAVTITSDGSTEATLVTPTPAISGTPAVGTPLHLDLPSSLLGMEQYLASQSATPPYSGILQIVWLRNGVPTGQLGTTYLPTAADAGAQIAARVSRDPLGTMIVGSILTSGAPTSFDTQPVTIPVPSTDPPSPPPAAGGPLPATGTPAPPAPAPATPGTTMSKPTVQVTLPRRVRAGSRPTVTVTVKSTNAVTGWVKVSLGTWSRRAQLQDGVVRVKLRRLAAGKYRVRGAYLGSATVAPGLATTTLRVKPRR